MKQNRGDQAAARGEVHLSLPGRDLSGLSLQLGRDMTRETGLAPSVLREASAASSAQAVITWLSQGQCIMLGTKYQIPVPLLRDVPGSCSYTKHGHALCPVPMGRASPATGPSAQLSPWKSKHEFALLLKNPKLRSNQVLEELSMPKAGHQLKELAQGMSYHCDSGKMCEPRLPQNHGTALATAQEGSCKEQIPPATEQGQVLGQFPAGELAPVMSSPRSPGLKVPAVLHSGHLINVTLAL